MAQRDTEPPALSWHAPFRNRDYVLLYTTNVCEFLASTLSRLSATQWLYEATGSAISLGALGAVTLVCQIPAIALGGVLADEFDRKRWISNVQTASTLIATVRFLLCLTGTLTPWHIYVTVGMLEICMRLESSSRAAIVAMVVPEKAIAHAVSIKIITQNVGEICAPFLFWALAESGGAATEGAHGGVETNATGTAGDRGATSLAVCFAMAALAFLPCALLPRLIRTDTRPAAAAEDEAAPNGGGSGGGGGGAASKVASRVRAMVDGLRYIMGHPLLPGLYALDWGFTVVSFYRELFPLFVGVWFTQGVPAGVSARGAVALLVMANYAGGIAGGMLTFALNSYPRKGRLVAYATMAYGVGCFSFGCTRQLLLGALAVFVCGGTDAVGATMRNTVVLVSTPDRLRGRAHSGHQLAAYVANSLGQLYVAAMVGGVGAGTTMKLGGGITELMTLLIAWRIPALMSYPRRAAHAHDGDAASSSRASEAAGTAGLATAVDPSWEGGEGGEGAEGGGVVPVKLKVLGVAVDADEGDDEGAPRILPTPSTSASS